MNEPLFIVAVAIILTYMVIYGYLSYFSDERPEQIMPSHVLPTLPPPPQPPPPFYFFDVETQKIHVMRSKERYAKCPSCGQPGVEMSTCGHCGAPIDG